MGWGPPSPTPRSVPIVGYHQIPTPTVCSSVWIHPSCPGYRSMLKITLHKCGSRSNIVGDQFDTCRPYGLYSVCDLGILSVCLAEFSELILYWIHQKFCQIVFLREVIICWFYEEILWNELRDWELEKSSFSWLCEVILYHNFKNLC